MKSRLELSRGMKLKVVVSLVAVLAFEGVAGAKTIYVPSRTYPTIQDGIDAASNGDVVEVAPVPNPYYPVAYTGEGNWDLDFGGLAITVRSQINPDNPNWDIIASTIIDCNEIANPLTGERVPHRAVQFHSGEGPDSRLMGFTIRNGYAQGDRGADGGSYAIENAGDPFGNFDRIPPPWCTDVNTCPPIGLPGADETDHGYGGAILCKGGASPTIKYCVITDCVVTGARGGDGAPGVFGPWSYWTLGDADPCYLDRIDANATPTVTSDGQWGGHGGDGEGNGYGGGIACRSGSSPIISDCIFTNNEARGGEGGRGGSGGWAEGAPDDIQGNESGGGDAGDSIGDGMGGAIYAESGCAPVVVNCTLSENIATAGPRARGGMRGLGDPTDPRAPIGAWGQVYTLGDIAGGAAYYGSGSDADFNNCSFTSNSAYDVFPFRSITQLEDPIVMGYTVGGALYCGNNTSVLINTCDFTDNLGGAIWCGTGSALTINNDYAVSVGSPERKCLFEGNSDASDWTELQSFSRDLGSGGAIFVDTSSIVDIQNCRFAVNSTKNDGGALKLMSNATISNCSFGGNVAEGGSGAFSGFGGAVDVYSGSMLTYTFTDCSFTGNQAWSGGGISSETFVGTFTRCYFVNNTAVVGGGMDLAYGDASLKEVLLSGNQAVFGSGGGLNGLLMEISVGNSTVRDNSAADSGGGINLYLGTASQTIRNCLIVGNEAGTDGGGVSCSVFATPAISNCTFSENTAGDFGGGVFSDWSSRPTITDCIFNNCDSGAIHEEDYGGDAEARFCLFYNNPDGDYYDSQTGTLFDGPGEVGGIPGGGTNLYGEPLFASGDLGEYYLSQVSAGQGMDSPAVDAGSAAAASVGMDEFTTRTDNVLDSGQVDIGYHYLDSGMVATFQLTTGVAGGQGTIEPPSGTYFAGTVVTLTATPRSGWRIKAWMGTDDDSLKTQSNTVVMSFDIIVSVEFGQPRTLLVSVGGGAGYYPTIQEAINDAEDGDTIVVYPGTYYSGYQNIVVTVNKSIEIRSLDPDDPCTVAATVIDGRAGLPGENLMGVWFLPGAGVGTVLNGFTITNCGGQLLSGLPGDRNQGHPDGYDGGSGSGTGIRISSGASPLIKNCIISNNQSMGGNGGDGVNATTDENAGRGGWGGYIHGGGVYCGVGSSPQFLNCRIINNIAQGGSGGAGGNDTDPGGEENYGGNWSASQALHYDPFSLDILFVEGDLWAYWGYLGDYYTYTGMGGGVYCDQGSEVTFTNCEISDNMSLGGMSGIGGAATPSGFLLEPEIAYRIPSFGGGVYCAAGSRVEFSRCTIASNVCSDPNDGAHRLDPYIGHGGGVCAEDTAEMIFDDCNVAGNIAPVGGGLHLANANPTVKNSRITGNVAFDGGGVFGEHGQMSFIETDIAGNSALSFIGDVNVVDVLGKGGGVHFWAADVDMTDCKVSNNQAQTSGGGAFFGGEGISSLFNCLITDNSAGRNGGGITNTTFSQLSVASSTLARNAASGRSHGGGISTSHEAYTDIIDSIIWGNWGENGAQLSVGTGFEYDYGPSTVSIWFSDIGPLAGEVAIVPDEDSNDTGAGSSATLIEAGTIYDQLDSGDGRAEVIVSLFEALDLRAETDWTDAASIAILKAEVANRQAAVLGTFTGDEFTLRYQYENQAGFSGTVNEAGLNKLLGNSLVQYIEPVRYFNVKMSQSLDLANAMAIRTMFDGTGVSIAIVDSGIDTTHVMLGGGGFPNSKVIGGYDTGEDDADPRPSIQPHGTACAGIAAGDEPDTPVGDYIGGVAPGAKLYALKISTDDDLFPTDSDIAAWEWCVDHKNDDPANPILVMSNSWGGFVPYNDTAIADAASPAMALAAENAVAAGITILAAAGNEFYTDGIILPAALSNVISVGAVYDTTDQVTPYSNTADILDILAPADPIHTTDMVGSAGYTPGDYTPNFNGTSAACPFAAGAVAVLQSAAKAELGIYLSPAQVRAILVATGELVTDTKVAITKPRVNLGTLIGALASGPIFVEAGCTDCEVIGWDINAVSNQWEPDFENYGNISEDPLFVDGYHLSQVSAGQSEQSPAVDAGSDFAVNLGLDKYTTRTDNLFDRGVVDMGYHYPFSVGAAKACSVVDLLLDGIIGFSDFAVFASRWLDEDCSAANGLCGGTDLTFDGVVDHNDLFFLVNCWLVEDTEAPIPNPSLWDWPPYATTSHSIAMTARRAVDEWGLGVEYLFQNVDYNDVNSGWIASEFWEANDLSAETEYGFKVRTRDTRGNTGSWSDVRCATTTSEPDANDLTPPSPDPMTWESPPTATSSTSISMTATTAIDPSGVEYYFDETMGTPGGTDSGWQSQATYTDDGLLSDTEYCYRVQARDLSINNNMTGWSATLCATTLSDSNDTNAPDPPPDMVITDVNTIMDPYDNTFSGQFQWPPGDQPWWHKVVADVSMVNDDSGGPIEIRFICVSHGEFSSESVIPALYRPILIGGTGTYGSFAEGWRLTYEGGNIIYDVDVDKYGGSGAERTWKVCAYDPSMNEACSTTHLIGSTF